MKKLIALLLSAAILLTGCTSSVIESGSTSSITDSSSISSTFDETSTSSTEAVSSSAEIETEPLANYDVDINSFTGLDDTNLHRYIEDSIYAELVTALASDDYFVENVSAIYISQEYLDEVAFNSQSNIYFGYTLSELNELFEGKRYVFTLGEDGKTDVKELTEIADTDSDTILRNAAIGTGVILICVTVSLVTGGAGAPAAVSAIFATAAKTAAISAASSAAIGGVSAGVVRGIETGDMSEALEAAALGASDEYMWGAVSGAISGGAAETVKYAKIIKSLKGTELVGLTKNQAAAIQMESGFPIDVVKQFHTMDEYNVLKKLKPKFVNGKTALIRNDIDWNLTDEYGRTNLQRAVDGIAPLDANGNSYELHHIGQRKDGTLAILTRSEHDNSALHGFLTQSEAHAEGTNWDSQRRAFWKSIAALVGG